MKSDKKILIIEDDELMIKILSFILTKEGYQLSVIRDGLSAINQLRIINPDMVITDLLLPYKSGLEVISYVKRCCSDKAIIAISTLGEEENTVSEVFKLGADDFVAKPFNPNELVLRVKRLFNQIDTRKNINTATNPPKLENSYQKTISSKFLN